MSIPGTISMVRLWRWRWIKNARSTAGYFLHPTHVSDDARRIVDELRNTGIAVRAYVGRRALFDAVLADARTRFDRAWDGTGLREDRSDWKQNREGMGDHEAKEFLVRLIPSELDATSPYVSYALQDDFLDIAESYLRMRCRLRAVHLWLNVPTRGEPTSTQLWHRDYDDLSNLKVFTYLSDVDETSGPFAFAPETQPGGKLYDRTPEETAPGRVADGPMGHVVPPRAWRICVGASGTTVFADTCGFHKGVKPVSRPRLMLMCHYTSPRSWTGPDLRVTGVAGAALSGRQVEALTDSAV